MQRRARWGWVVLFVGMPFLGFGQDQDEDGFDEAQDNCPMAANENQADADGDGVGDVCDNCADTPNPGREVNGSGHPATCAANPVSTRRISK